ncbi:MAG: hypothetical protein H0W96_13680 [Solirubrobacterales bacterium]|nr:hypothetical protein [Solirubrobacterales bacterium]
MSLTSLALRWYEETTGLPRDGQAFSGTMVLGAGFALLGAVLMPFVLASDRGWAALARGSLAALIVAVAVVGYTASRGYLMGGLTGGTPCIVVGTGPSGPICAPPGGPTYIADAQPDVFVMVLATIAAWALAHLGARLRGQRAIR